PGMIPQELATLLGYMLERDAGKRPESALAVKRELEGIAERLGMKPLHAGAFAQVPPLYFPQFRQTPYAQGLKKGTPFWQIVVVLGSLVLVICGSCGYSGWNMMRGMCCFGYRHYIKPSGIAAKAPAEKQVFTFGMNSPLRIEQLDPGHAYGADARQ